MKKLDTSSCNTRASALEFPDCEVTTKSTWSIEERPMHRMRDSIDLPSLPAASQPVQDIEPPEEVKVFGTMMDANKEKIAIVSELVVVPLSTAVFVVSGAAVLKVAGEPVHDVASVISGLSLTPTEVEGGISTAEFVVSGAAEDTAVANPTVVSFVLPVCSASAAVVAYAEIDTVDVTSEFG